MILILRRPWRVMDVTIPRQDRIPKETIGAGRHEVERIPNPFPRGETDFIVLKGTRIGAAERYWMMHEEEGPNSVDRVVIEK